MSDPVYNNGKLIAIGVPSTVASGVKTNVYYVVYCSYNGHLENSTDDADETFIFDSDGNNVSNRAWYAVPGNYTVEIRSKGDCPSIGADKAPLTLIAEDITFEGSHAPTNASLIDLAMDSANAPSLIEAEDGTLSAGPQGLHAKYVSIKHYPTFLRIINLDLSRSSPRNFIAAKVLEASEAPTLLGALEQLISDDAPTSLEAVKQLGISDAPTLMDADIGMGDGDNPTGITSAEILSVGAAPTTLLAEDTTLWHPRNVTVTSLYLGEEMTNHHPRNVVVTEITLGIWDQPTDMSAGFELSGLNAPFGLFALRELNLSVDAPTQITATEIPAAGWASLNSSPTGLTAEWTSATWAPDAPTSLTALDVTNTSWATSANAPTGLTAGTQSFAGNQVRDTPTNLTATDVTNTSWATNNNAPTGLTAGTQSFAGTQSEAPSGIAASVITAAGWATANNAPTGLSAGTQDFTTNQIEDTPHGITALDITTAEWHAAKSTPSNLTASITLRQDFTASPGILTAIPFEQMKPTGLSAVVGGELTASNQPQGLHAAELGEVLVGYDPTQWPTTITTSYEDPSEFLFEYDGERFWDSGYIDYSWDGTTSPNGYFNAGGWNPTQYPIVDGLLVGGYPSRFAYPFSCKSFRRQSADLFNWGDIFVGENGSVVHTVAWRTTWMADYDCDEDGYFDTSEQGDFIDAHWYRTPSSDIDAYIMHLSIQMAQNPYQVINGSPYTSESASEIYSLMKAWESDAISKSKRAHWSFLRNIVHKCRLEGGPWALNKSTYTGVYDWKDEWANHATNSLNHPSSGIPSLPTQTPIVNWVGLGKYQPLDLSVLAASGTPCDEETHEAGTFLPGHIPWGFYEKYDLSMPSGRPRPHDYLQRAHAAWVRGRTRSRPRPFYTPWGHEVNHPNPWHDSLVTSSEISVSGNNWAAYLGPKYHPRTHEDNFSFGVERLAGATKSRYQNPLGYPREPSDQDCDPESVPEDKYNWF